MPPELSLVISCYNEEANIETVAVGLVAALERHAVDFELVLVDNGSGDGTRAHMERLVRANPRLSCKVVERNEGYGTGVRAGLRAASGRFVGYVWGDGQIDPKDVVTVYRPLREGRCDLAKANRVVRRDGLARKIQSSVYNRLFALLFRVPAADQNGTPKIFRSEWLGPLDLESKDWFLDAEIMIKAKALEMDVVNVPIAFLPRRFGASKVRLSAVLEFLLNMLQYRFGSRLARWEGRLGQLGRARSPVR